MLYIRYWTVSTIGRPTIIGCSACAGRLVLDTGTSQDTSYLCSRKLTTKRYDDRTRVVCSSGRIGISWVVCETSWSEESVDYLSEVGTCPNPRRIARFGYTESQRWRRDGVWRLTLAESTWYTTLTLVREQSLYAIRWQPATIANRQGLLQHNYASSHIIAHTLRLSRTRQKTQ